MDKWELPELGIPLHFPQPIPWDKGFWFSPEYYKNNSCGDRRKVTPRKKTPEPEEHFVIETPFSNFEGGEQSSEDVAEETGLKLTDLLKPTSSGILSLESLLAKHQSQKMADPSLNFNAPEISIPPQVELSLKRPLPDPTPTKLEPPAKKLKIGTLNGHEHKQYLDLTNQLNSGSRVSLDIAEQELFSRVSTEQDEFKKEQCEQIRNLDQSDNPYLHIRIPVKSLVQPILEHQKKTFSNYPAKYFPHHEIDLIQDLVDAPSCGFAPDTNLLMLGKLFHVKPLTAGQAFPRDMGECYSFLPEESQNTTEFPDYGIPKPCWVKYPCPPISKDGIAGVLVADSKLEIDIAISSSTICALASTHPGNPDDVWEIPVVIQMINNKKVIFFDKPLPKKKLSIHEMNQIYYNLAYKYTTLNTQKQPAVPLKSNPSIFRDANYLASCSNMTYVIWKLGDFRVLVRAKYAGYMENVQTTAPPQPQSKGEGTAHTGIRTKLEYFSREGNSDPTPSEMTRWWAYMHIRPHSQTILAKVDPKRNEVVGTSRLGPSAVNPEEFIYKFMLLLFKKVHTLEAGNYLVTHQNGNSVQICSTVQDSPTSGCINLDPREYSVLDETVFEPFISNYWPKTTADRRNRVKYTFLPKHPSQLAHFKYGYCYQFADKGICTNNDCHRPHYTKEEVGLIREWLTEDEAQKREAKEKRTKEKKKKQRKKKKKAPTKGTEPEALDAKVLEDEEDKMTLSEADETYVSDEGGEDLGGEEDQMDTETETL